MYYIASLSGGTQSVVAADRAIERYGRTKVILSICDVKWEDDDLWRFVDDCMRRWGGKLYRFTDGRTPLELAEDRQIISNQYLAPCSYELKKMVFLEWLWRVPKNVTVLLGYNYDEQHRIARRQHWHKMSKKWKRPSGYQAIVPGVYEDYPLLWKPYEFRQSAEVVERDWGIQTPLLTRLGFPHNNCGGRCVKQGIREWQRLKVNFPERFDEVRDWEQMMRAKGGTLENRAICRDQSDGKVTPLTLREIEKRNVPDLNEPVQTDLFTCLCTY